MQEALLLFDRKKKNKEFATCITNPPVIRRVSYVNFLNNYRIYELHIFKQQILGRKETKEKKIYATCKVRLHDEPLCSQNRSSLAKPNGTDSGTNIRHSLCNPPSPTVMFLQP